jgi:hypothetical protein
MLTTVVRESEQSNDARICMVMTQAVTTKIKIEINQSRGLTRAHVSLVGDILPDKGLGLQEVGACLCGKRGASQHSEQDCHNSLGRASSAHLDRVGLSEKYILLPKVWGEDDQRYLPSSSSATVCPTPPLNR